MQEKGVSILYMQKVLREVQESCSAFRYRGVAEWREARGLMLDVVEWYLGMSGPDLEVPYLFLFLYYREPFFESHLHPHLPH